MQLRRLEIENFRGITKLDLAISDTTVLIGENNTGKTAVLDALKFALRGKSAIFTPPSAATGASSLSKKYISQYIATKYD